MRYKTFFKIGSWALLATAGFHAVSFFVPPTPENESERQMLDLMSNYQMDMGAGIQRSMQELFNFFSITFSFLALFAGGLNLLLVRYFDHADLARKVVGFNALAWTAFLIPLYFLTFLPPQVCYTIAWAGFVLAWFRLRKISG